MNGGILNIYGSFGENPLGVQYNGVTRDFHDVDAMCRYVLSAAPSFVTISLNVRHGDPRELKRFFGRNTIPAELVD